MFGESYLGETGFAEVVGIVQSSDGNIARKVYVAQQRVYDFESSKRQTVFIALPKARDYDFSS